MALQIHQNRAEPAAAPERKIVDPKVEDGASGQIGQSHDAAQDRLTRGVHTQTCRQAGSSFSAGGQSDGGDLLAGADCHPGPGSNQVRKALRKDFALTQRIAAEEFAHAESQLDTTTTTGDISHRSAVPAMNGGRWVTAQGTAGHGMRGDDRDAYFVLAGLDLINLHPFGKREQRVSFHRNLVSLSKRSDEFFWKEAYHIFSLFLISAVPDSPNLGMSLIMALPHFV
jgi:hypothetical protein